MHRISARIIYFLLIGLAAVGPNSTVYAKAGSLDASQLTTLIDGDLKYASKRIASEIEQYPNDAELRKVAGDIFAVRAQGASIFSAPGLAKKILRSYKKAVELAPENTEYRTSLMQFYLFAPGIVGGSKKLAVKQATEIKRLDPVAGVVAESLVLVKAKNEQGLAELFDKLSPELVDHPKIKMAHANYLRSVKQFEPSLALSQELMALNSDALPQDQALLPYQAMLQIGFLANKSEAHRANGIKAFEDYLETAPDSYKLMSKKWVRLFLGQLYAKVGQLELAKTTLLAARQSATDKTLMDKVDEALDDI